ncbi:MAG: hypothetical protein ABI275_03375 [Terrimesophilobacter sp.]
MRGAAHRSLRGKATFTLGLALFIALSATGVGFAAWNTTSTVTASATAATTRLQITGIDGLNHNYRKAGKLVATVTLANTGSAPLTYSLGGTGAVGRFASSVTLTIWAKTKDPCRAGQGKYLASGTLESPPALPAEVISAAPGSKVFLCVMTSLDDVTGLVGLGVTGTFTISGVVGNWSTSASAVFSQTDIDSQAPSKPGTPAALNAAATSLTLVWAASTDNVGVTGYEIIRDDESIGTSSSTAFTDDSFVAGKRHSYKVKAVDAAGNVSTASTSLKIPALVGDPSPWYQVVDPNSGMCVDGVNEQADGAPLIVSPCGPTAVNSQAWRFTPILEGTFTVMAGYGTNPVWSVVDGTAPGLWAPGATADQRWTLVPSPAAGTFRFIAGAGTCLAVPGTASGTKLVQDVCGSGAGQAFRLVRVP